MTNLKRRLDQLARRHPSQDQTRRPYADPISSRVLEAVRDALSRGSHTLTEEQRARVRAELEARVKHSGMTRGTHPWEA